MRFFDIFKKNRDLPFVSSPNTDQRLIETFNLLPKPFFLVDIDNQKISFSNTAARRMMGLDYAERPASLSYLKDFTLWDHQGNVVPASDLPSARVMRGGAVSGEEFILQTSTGRYEIKVFTQDIPPVLGQQRSALIIFQDITALKAIERDWKTLADSMPQIVWSANAEGELDYFNQVWFDYSGSTYEMNKGNGWVQFVHPDEVDITGERWKKSLEHKTYYENEFRLRSKDGGFRWFVARARPILDTNGLVKKWYGTNTDIHDQKLMTESLSEARAVAERANSAKSQFLANMSHEIRTPLGAIMGFSQLIKENGLSRGEREEYVAVIERNSSQLLRIIDDILDLSKVEAGMMLIESLEFSLPEALTDFSSLMGFKAREKGILFVSRAVTTLPSIINSDPTRLRQILMNVVGNAIKFTDRGQVEMRVGYVDGFLEFEIEDTGRGISSEQERNLFQPFTQADASTTRKYGGTGLGLVLTRSLAEALGGEFFLKRSELGKGSTFFVRIRAPSTSNSVTFSGLGFESAAPRSVVSSGQLANLRILLVEDSPDNQALISIYLARAGASADIASDGEQGINLANKSNYDVVLMDVQMPIMDGITAVKKMRESGYTKPIIALTAHAMKEERTRCIEAGFTDFLSKPLTREDLINMILDVRNENEE